MPQYLVSQNRDFGFYLSEKPLTCFLKINVLMWLRCLIVFGVCCVETRLNTGNERSLKGDRIWLFSILRVPETRLYNHSCYVPKNVYIRLVRKLE